MKPSDRRDLELFAEIRDAKRAVNEAREVVGSKEARGILREKALRLVELEDEAADGTPDLPLVSAIAANQDARHEQVPEAPRKPKDDLGEQLLDCLHHACLQRTELCEKEWAKYPGPMSDAEIREVIRLTWPTGEVFVPASEVAKARHDARPYSLGYSLIGGTEPRFWHGGRHVWNTPVTFEGAALLAKVREVMEVLYREATVDEKLDAALEHVLRNKPFGDEHNVDTLEGMTDREILLHLGWLWPDRPAHMRFADESEDVEGFSIVSWNSTHPKIYLGVEEVLPDGPSMLRGDRLAERVRKVLGLAEVIDTMAAPLAEDEGDTGPILAAIEAEAARPMPSWASYDAEMVIDDLVERTGLALMNRKADAPLSGPEILSHLAWKWPAALPTFVSAKLVGGEWGYGATSKPSPRVWMGRGEIDNVFDLRRENAGGDFAGKGLVAEILKALDRDHARPEKAKPRKSRAKAVKS